MTRRKVRPHPRKPDSLGRPYVRFTRWRRRRFFALLEESGNVRMAAELAGVGLGAIYRLRIVEPGFADKMAAARREAGRRLAEREGAPEGAPPPRSARSRAGSIARPARSRIAGGNPTQLSPANAGEDRDPSLVIRRGVGGRLRVMAAGPHCWEARHDVAFLLHLRATGNVTAAARSIGFTPKVAHDRRKRLPGFAAAWDRAMKEVARRLESELLEAGMIAAGITYHEAFEPEPPETKFDPWLALAVLRYWDRKERGARRRG